MKRSRLLTYITFSIVVVCFALYFIFSAWVNSIENSKYRDIAAFKSDIEKWKIEGLPLIEAKLIFEANGFSCKGNSCYKDAPGFPCNQRQKADFTLSVDGKVMNVKPLEIKGVFPTQCL